MKELIGFIPAALLSVSPNFDLAIADLSVEWQIVIRLAITAACYLITVFIKWLVVTIKNKIKNSKKLTEEEKEEILKPVDITKSDLDNSKE